MTNLFFRATQFVQHRYSALGAHGLHSPFVYRLLQDVIRKKSDSLDPDLERLRKRLIRSKDRIPYVDFKTGTQREASLSYIARTSPSRPQFSAFLQRLCELLQVNVALETGTSLGINALYLSRANSVKQVITLEGNEAIASLAREEISQRTKKVEVVIGNIYDTYPEAIRNYQPQLIFLDADHRDTALDFYLEQTTDHLDKVKCLVVHDIYWSPQMHAKWNELINDDRFPLTIDLFQAGLLFPNMALEKQHFRLRF